MHYSINVSYWHVNRGADIIGLMRFDILYFIMALVIVLVSLILHELGHGYVAYLLGDDTAKMNGRLTLNPIKHIDPFLTIILPLSMALIGAPIIGGAKPVPFNPNNVKGGEWGVALVALAGPMINFIIAFILFGVWAIARPSGILIGQLISLTISVNLGLFVFNLIPFPPLDGSRLLYALAPDFFRSIMTKIESFGVVPFFIIFILANSVILKFISCSMTVILQFFTSIFIR